MNPPRIAVWSGAIAAAALIGSSATAAVPIRDFPVLGGQALRFALAAAVLLLLVRWRGPAPGALGPLDWLVLAGLSATGIAGFNVFLVLASQHGHPAVVGTVLAAAPVALATVGPLLDGRRPRVRIVAGCVVVAAGTGLTAGLGPAGAVAVALAMGALACEVGFTLLAVPLLPKLGALRVSGYAAAGAVPLLLFAGWAVDGAEMLRTPTGPEALALGYQALFVAVLANLLWYAALPGIRADRGGLAYGAVPVGATGAALVLGMGAPPALTFVGMGVAVFGLVIGLLPGPGRRAATTVTV